MKYHTKTGMISKRHPEYKRVMSWIAEAGLAGLVTVTAMRNGVRIEHTIEPAMAVVWFGATVTEQREAWQYFLADVGWYTRLRHAETVARQRKAAAI